jgi:hypothetical protein
MVLDVSKMRRFNIKFVNLLLLLLLFLNNLKRKIARPTIDIYTR